MRNILLAVDGSDHAFRAMLFLVNFVKEHGLVTIHVVNVESRPLLCSPCGTEAGALDRHDAILAHMAIKPILHALNEEGIPYQLHTRLGEVAKTLVAAAGELGCDTIVMGSRGMGGIPGLAVGSVTRKVLHLSTLPVVCVK